MPQQVLARVVDVGEAGVCFEDALAGDFAGKVFACVEEFEEAADSIVVLVWELDLSLLLGALARAVLFLSNNSIYSFYAIFLCKSS